MLLVQVAAPHRGQPLGQEGDARHLPGRNGTTTGEVTEESMKIKSILISRSSTKTLEAELLRRALRRTGGAILHAQETLIALERKRVRQRLELERQGVKP